MDDSSPTLATVVVEVIMCPNKTCNTGCVSRHHMLICNTCNCWVPVDVVSTSFYAHIKLFCYGFVLIATKWRSTSSVNQYTRKMLQGMQ